MGHDHSHTHGITATGRHRKRLIAVLAITLTVVLVQVVGAGVRVIGRQFGQGGGATLVPVPPLGGRQGLIQCVANQVVRKGITRIVWVQKIALGQRVAQRSQGGGRLPGGARPPRQRHFAAQHRGTSQRRPKLGRQVVTARGQAGLQRAAISQGMQGLGEQQGVAAADGPQARCVRLILGGQRGREVIR